jgi:hypothetical protein
MGPHAVPDQNDVGIRRREERRRGGGGRFYWIIRVKILVFTSIYHFSG